MGLHKSRALGGNTFRKFVVGNTYKWVLGRSIVRGLADQQSVQWLIEQSIAKDGSPSGHLKQVLSCEKTRNGAEKVRLDVEPESRKAWVCP